MEAYICARTKKLLNLQQLHFKIFAMDLSPRTFHMIIWFILIIL